MDSTSQFFCSTMFLQGVKLAFALLALGTPSWAVGVTPGQIKNFVTFGDSYTDSSYYPTADGGYAWPTWAAMYGDLNLYGFARSGATCSNLLTYRPFPPIMGWQLPAYLNETKNGTLELDPKETMYTIWIGTNDLGANALITGSNAPSTSIVQVRQCAIDVLKTLYESGARNFIMQNILPLDLTILYSNYSYPSRYWDLERNTTEWNVYMKELVRAGNEITSLMLDALVPTLPGAHIASFDSYALFTDMYNNPQNYFNGTAPYNVTGCINSCVYTTNSTAAPTCTVANGTDRDSFLWYDELHPSQQSDRIVAREITAVMKGEQNQWTTWLS
ncbi:carbohydrate esterase family 16 protein [Suillus clintonianus]|uniref:carbohydrate esterase family 16 protein n=1 Tax=Suillus clintonianus TaxID=1904413 RepID=UPI001B863759|nr:carbohydrate esterase family 16 protein [Suillus clintonianus]KAG2130906.1 carbohydrate esterase family 16 protein [Suillus clintonianus]